MDSLASQSQKSQSWLTWFYRGLLIFIFAVLVARTAELQIVKGEYYRNLADNNRIRKITIKAPRGKILARGGEELVGNREVKKEIIFLPQGGYEKKETNKTDGESVISEWEREYYLGSDFAHVGGYIAQVNEEEVGKVDPDCQDKGPRKLGSQIGRSGLELAYECVLRGIDGEELIEVDTMGRKVRTLGVKEAIAGSDIKTTIDINLQRKLADTFKNIQELKQIKLESDGKKGASVITDPEGQVLAFYSSPSYDPTDISKSITDSDLPLFNRVLGGAYHPGSAFKIVTSVAGLEDKRIDAKYTYTDTGVVEVNGFEYKNWYLTQYGSTEGLIDLTKALARSTDTFFYKLGEAVGANSLASWARKMGYGQKTGIDLPGEIQGLVPDPEWKKEYKGENWFLGNTYHMAIGQGDLTATPLEVNRATMVIANNGKLCRPYVSGKKLEKDCTDLNIDKKNIALIKEGMVKACSAGGTAFPFFSINDDDEKRVACKTGTAQTEEENRTHAWFTVFGPVANPEIVMTVLVEKGGEGSYAASPIAKEIFDYWYLQKNP
jgi:penicillin-binding protein 2